MSLRQHVTTTYAVTTATVTDWKRHLVYAIEPEGLLAVLHPTSGRLRTIVVGAGPTGLALDEHTGDVYVTNSKAGTVSVVRDEQVVKTVRLPRKSEPTAVMIDPSSGLVYVADTGSGQVSVVSGTRLLRSLKVGKLPSALTELGHTVYVADTGSGRLSMLRGKSVVGTVLVGGAPAVLAADPRLRSVYALDPLSATVLVVHKARLTTTIQLRPGSVPDALAVSSRTGTTVVLEAGSFDRSTSTITPPGLALVADTTLVSDQVDDAGPTGLAVDPRTGDVVVGTDVGKGAFALHGRTVIATGKVQFQGAAVMRNGRFYAGTGLTPSNGAIDRVTLSG